MIGVVLIVIATLAYNVATDNTPILGLDLQGGVSVILAPTEPATAEELTVIRDQIRSELERQGIAEPDVRVHYRNPFDEESEYYAFCLPAFSPERAGREA